MSNVPMSVKNRSESIPFLHTLKSTFATYDDVLLAYLFGSHARGQAGPLSDVDVAVLLAKDLDAERHFMRQLDIISDVQHVLGRDDVDVILLDQVPLALRYRVLRDGILLTCRDRQIMIDFTMRTVSAYLDFKPFIERHEHMILERARKGALLDGYNPHRGALERYRRLRTRLAGTTAAER